MSIASVAGVALVTAVCVLLVRELRPSMAVLVRVAGVVVLTAGALTLFAPIVARIRSLATLSGDTALSGVLLRALGIALITELSASLCRELGEGTLASAVGLFGKLEILLLSLPFVEGLLRLAEELLKW